MPSAARLSLGARLCRGPLGLLEKFAAELPGSGTFISIVDSTISPKEVNRWFGSSPFRSDSFRADIVPHKES
jgi:hypothetical protein